MYFEYYILLALLPLVAPTRLKGWCALLVVACGVGVSSIGAVNSLLGFAPPLFAPVVGRVAALFSLLFSFVFLVVLLYTLRADRLKGSHTGLHIASIVTLYYALQGILIATSVYNFLFYWELMSIALFLLMNLRSESREVMHSAVSFFVVMHAGFFVLIGAFCALPASDSLFGVGNMSFVVWLLFAVGFMIKSAVFPFHFWLPSSYSISPAWVTALMGGAVTNIGLYGLIRVMLVVQNVEAASFVLMGLGAASALYGAFRLPSSHSLRKMLSYSSIDNIGLVVLALGFGFYGKAMGHTELAFYGFLGAVLQLVFHAVAKTLLYLSLGAVDEQTKDDRTSALGGVAHKMPRTSLFFAIGALSLMALAPMAGFFGEFMILSAFFRSVESAAEPIVGIIGIIVVALVAAITIFTLCKSFSVAFLGRARSKAASNISERLTIGEWIAYLSLCLVLVVGGVLAWLGAEIVGELFSINAAPYTATANSATLTAIIAVGLFVILSFGLWWLRGYLTKGREKLIEPTWACGQGEPSPDEQYNDESFASEVNATFSLPEHSARGRAISRKLIPVNVMRRMTGRLAFLQTGLTSHYILHIVLFLTLILILTITGVL